MRRERDRLRAELGAERTTSRTLAAEVALLRAALDAVPTGVVVVAADGAVVRRSAMPTGGGAGDVLVDEAVDAVVRAALAGSVDERIVDLYGPPARQFVVRGVPLPGGGALASVDDVSERARLDAVRTDFVANISHELRTPVGALAVLADTLADDDDPEVVRQLARRMVDEAHRASSTIDDLLELSRIELGGAAVRDVVDVGEVVAAAMQRTAGAAAARGVRVVVDDPHPPKAIGDSRQLVSAVANLLDNAVKYSDEGAEVHVRVERCGDGVEIAVIDRGIGIPARDLDRIFERFYRVDRARSRDTGGTGLGLAIVRHVATNHGGEVRVESHEGEGSTFVLRIPVGDRALDMDDE
ncbi:MAG: sensor histidine kinase [Ilumatobacteraceae bacterium]